MDLIFLEPGDPTILGDAHGGRSGLVEQTPRNSHVIPGNVIELISIQQGMKQPLSTEPGNSVRSSGHLIMSEITCVKHVDESSVVLYEHCLRAQPLGKGAGQPSKIHIMRCSGDTTTSVMTVQLRDALISEIQLQSHPDDMPTEQFKINFTEILWEYAAHAADVPRTSAKLHTGWSLLRNRPITAFGGE